MILRLIVGFIFLVGILDASATQKLQTQADSLFAQQKYTEAFQVYESVFQAGQFSESMLLKMAFIKDGLGNYVDALYYLDLYYKNSADKSVVGKIEEISQEMNLTGYSYNDSHFFMAMINKYRGQIILALLAVALFLTVYTYKKRQLNEKPITASVFQLLTLTALLVLSNGAYEGTYGIISQNSTLLRNGPSAGAEPVMMIDKGHKVTVIDRSEVWTKIDWDGEEVFLRNGKIKII
ncbi:MAG: SH3 domain-containing protein [Cyclobacteriaceae bacterium]